MEVLLAGVPDAGVEVAENEAVVAGLPAVVYLVRVRLVHAVVDAVVAPLLIAVGLGDALGALAPVRGDEGGGGEEQSHQVEPHGEQRAAFPRRLHRANVASLRSAKSSSKAERTSARSKGIHGSGGKDSSLSRCLQCRINALRLIGISKGKRVTVQLSISVYVISHLTSSSAFLRCPCPVSNELTVCCSL